MATFKKCDGNVRAMCQALVDKYHPELGEAEVSIDLVFAYGSTNKEGETVGSAITKQGMQVRAVGKKVSLKDRVKGHGDVEITLDGDRWEAWGEKTQKAILDHELTAFMVRKDEEGELITDDLGRPKIFLRPLDRRVEWFDAVAKRWERNSPEWTDFNDIWQSCRQMEMDFMQEIG